MGLLTTIAAIGVGVAGVGTYKSVQAQKKSASLQREANQFQQKQANLQNARNKRDAVRASRLAYGTAQNTAANQGVGESSGAMGGQGSIASQGRDNVSFLDQYGFYSDQAASLLGRANQASANASMWNSIGGFGMTLAGNAGTIDSAWKGIKSKFTGPTPPQAPTG